MPLTRDYRETIYENLQRSSLFRREYLSGALNGMIDGDFEIGRTALRNYVNGTLGFTQLGELMQRSPKSLMRMLSPKGNPQARNLFDMIVVLQRHEGVKLELRARRAA